MLEKPATLRESYQARLAAGDLKPDPAQARAVDILQNLADSLKGYEAPAGKETNGVLAGLRRIVARRPFETGPADGRKSGLYIYGDVGRGKSMLMDLFMEHVDVARKRRVHFHQFMLEIHARLEQLRRKGDVNDIMASLVRGIAAETSLLCFDEFHVSNIADAMILGRLFSGLFDAGVVVIATSNSAPDELYKNGLQRDRFQPFIDMIKDRVLVHKIEGAVDYRYEQMRRLDTYFHPLGDETTRKLQGIFLNLTHDAQTESIPLQISGRKLTISRATHGIGFFNFDELCQEALGAADYLAIAACLHTVVLDGVPVQTTERRNETVRFMTLIDALYEARVKLFMAADAAIERLAPANDLTAPFQRTISRLVEMQGEPYRLKAHMG
jgi:cell division protein ZapE